ncbi:rhb1p [Saccharomyces arboricola H-6]|uniref:Rhb1p n=1 Tax=Saccharomyces arboricola (strain H-6 / AS 2.3317 / CBS 10644) TaxID=1160507 RepID=J8QA94_SACAR|nr:rhb1p [Saccharomyces arboricola H-6]
MEYSSLSPSNSTHNFQRKIALIGARNVGKTTLTVRFVESRFVESYYPTIENEFTKIIPFKNHDCTLEILDTAGQDEESLLNMKSLVGVRGIILCYSIVNRASFDLIPILWDKVVDQLGRDNVPVILVGTKSDLERGAKGENRRITKAEGEKLASTIGSQDKRNQALFIECSAEQGFNVEETFMLLLKQMEHIEGSVIFDGENNNKCNIM